VSIRLQNELIELRTEVQRLARELAQIQALITAMTRQATPPKGKAA
jgi:hypothetical protein